jgi:hypothetical protein
MINKLYVKGGIAVSPAYGLLLTFLKRQFSCHELDIRIPQGFSKSYNFCKASLRCISPFVRGISGTRCSFAQASCFDGSFLPGSGHRHR